MSELRIKAATLVVSLRSQAEIMSLNAKQRRQQSAGIDTDAALGLGMDAARFEATAIALSAAADSIAKLLVETTDEPEPEPEPRRGFDPGVMLAWLLVSAIVVGVWGLAIRGLVSLFR